MRKKLVILGVLLLSGILSLWGLSARTLDNHECFVSVTAREMLANGNWVLPTFNGSNRLQKTPLSYWLVACISKITGEVDEFTARLPSAVFGFLSVCAIIYFVAQWLSLRTALLCAAVWVTSLGYIRYSHDARPEMAMTFFVTLCFLSFYSVINAPNRKRQVVYMLIFWVSFALGNLAKGPAPIPMVLVPLFFYVLLFRLWKQVPKLLPVAGTLVFLAIVLPWPLAVAHRVNWDLVVWKQQFVDRFFGESDSGGKPAYYYLPQIFMFITPWFIFLPMALAMPFYRVWAGKRQVIWYLWICFVADLIFITLSSGKRQHYIIPIMPVMAVLIGILLEDIIFVREAVKPGQAKVILMAYIAVVILAAGGGIVYVAMRMRELLPATIVASGVLAGGVVFIGILFARKRPTVACGVIFTWITVLVMFVFTGFVNPLDYNEMSRIYSKKISQMVPQDDKMVAYITVTPRFIHYFGKTVPEITDANELTDLYNRGYWIAAFGKCLDELQKQGQFELVYTEKDVERHRDKLVAGGIFHKKK